MGSKIRIFKLAKELNIASDTLIEYLHDFGSKVSNVNSPIDDEMYSKIMDHFSAEKTLAERKVLLRIKRAQMRGDAEGVDEQAAVDTIGADVKQPKEAKKPAILEALASLKKSADADKLKAAVDDGKVVDESASVEEVKVTKKKTKTKKIKKIVKEVTEVEASDSDVVDEEVKPKEVEKVTEKDVEEVFAEAPVAEVETEPEPEKEYVQKIGEQVDTIELPVEKPRRKKKVVVDDSKKSRKLSKKGRGLAEKIKEKKQVTVKTDSAATDGDDKKGKKRKHVRKKRIDSREIDASIKETMAKMDESQKLKKYKKKAQNSDEEFEDESIIDVTEYLSVAELANLMQVETNEVIKKCLELGLIVSINQRLDMDTITMVSDEFGFGVNEISEYEEFGFEEEEIDEEDLEECPPVVTIMGHVDHGKTSLLDYIRQSNVVAGEKGGITQHIGAYEVEIQEKCITFLDTPGHEAFTAMRARGAQVTDIVVLIIAADDSVMPQTLEALNHAQAAEVPVIVAINKIDKPETDIERIKQQLSEQNVLVESWGGKYPSVDVSAKTGQGIDELLETILIQAELLELKVSPNGRTRGFVIESRVEKGRGTVCAILVKNGTLKIGDYFVCGQHYGRVKAMFNERGVKVKSASSSTPIQVIGFSGMPQAGDVVTGMDSDREAKALSLKRQQLKRERDFRRIPVKSLYDISEQVKLGKIKDLKIVLKGDTDGSIEAIEDSLLKLSNDEVDVKIIHKSIGAINEADVLLATASGGIIIGFHVRPNFKARTLAAADKVDIQLYDVIYDVIEDVRATLEGMLEPDIKEEIESTIEVRDTFRVPKAGVIAGCYVVSGKVLRNSKIRLVRDGIEVYDGTIDSLRRFKDDVKDVASGFECGIGLKNFNDIKVGDFLESYKNVEVKRVLLQ